MTWESLEVSEAYRPLAVLGAAALCQAAVAFLDPAVLKVTLTYQGASTTQSYPLKVK